MKRGIKLFFVVLMAMVLPLVEASDSILWEGEVCKDVPYQKSIEAVAIKNGTIYIGCSYRQVTNSSGFIGIYYLGQVYAYSQGGKELWWNDSGYVIGLYPLNDGKLIVGSFGGFVTFDKNGKFLARNLTSSKLYDFQIVDDNVYAVDGEVFTGFAGTDYVGHLYTGKVVNGSVVLNGWKLNFSTMTSRVRVGNIIYVGSGFPSGYTGPEVFGEIMGISKNGTILWNLNLGEWVRDMELLDGDIIVGTGLKDTSTGRLYRISPEGNVIWNESMFYVEDIEVGNGLIYVGGINEKGGVIVALGSETGEVKWRAEFPWRVKVIKLAGNKLLAGTGKFETKDVNGTVMVYSVGSLYILDPITGKQLGEISNTGYVRSIATEGNIAVIGTASSKFYVVDLSGFEEKKICGPASMLILLLLLISRRASH